MNGKVTFRSPWNILVCGSGLLLLLVGYATASETPWTQAPFTITASLVGGLWMSVRGALCAAWVDPSGIRYLGVFSAERIPWAVVEEVTCELRGGTLMTSAMPVLKLKGGRSVSLDGLAGYTLGNDENSRVTRQVHEMNATLKLHRSIGRRPFNGA
ncbi:hypothetical protein [Streptomyces sp. NPDC057939]|uniref:hypothetical protein n=1 Tax=Streptomyces sp. NPDC057939 TaxID=3346284 RepID=UPI0036EC897B